MKKSLLAAALSLVVWSPAGHAGFGDDGSAEVSCDALLDEFQSQQRALRRAAQLATQAREAMGEVEWMREEIVTLEAELEQLHVLRDTLEKEGDADADGTVPDDAAHALQELSERIWELEWQIQDLYEGISGIVERARQSREVVQQLRAQAAELRAELQACEASGT